MLTKVRVCKNKPHTLSIERTGEQYQHLVLEFLLPRTKDSDERYLEPAFTIRWQASDSNPEWYGMHYVCDTENVWHLEQMLKCVKKIKDANLYYTEQKPEIIMGILKSELHTYDNGMFVPMSYNGGKCYRLMIRGESYAVIHARYEKQAYEIAEKITTNRFRLGQTNWELESMYDLQFEPVSLKSDLV